MIAKRIQIAKKSNRTPGLNGAEKKVFKGGRNRGRPRIPSEKSVDNHQHAENVCIRMAIAIGISRQPNVGG